ncbi:alpha-1-antitrypsin-like [Grammomys surdaster]|uniref:alpha-1-antitrypsin-like n=1 Tax=Grammomys surdaster TaxID=491861 RepID=UPI0010A023AB|nr:alpha-1-antitrypsin-like [Grammomys surdaster]
MPILIISPNAFFHVINTANSQQGDNLLREGKCGKQRAEEKKMSPSFYRNFFLLASLCCVLLGSQTNGYQDPDVSYLDKNNQELTQCQKITPTITNISLFLLQKATHWPKLTNVVFSPVNIMAAFEMLSLGAKGSTHHQILKGLRLSLINMTEKEVHKCFQYFLHILFQPNQQVQLTMGSSLFIARHLRIVDKFKKLVTESYHSEVIPIDFRNTQEAMEQVNRHVEEQTYGHIVQVVKELPVDTVLALVNYIYFEGFQNSNIQAEYVMEEKFHLDTGMVRFVTMVHRLGEFYLHKDSSLSSWVLLQHYAGNAMAFFILPDLGKMQQLIQNLSHEYLNSIERHINPRFVSLYFPKLTISATYDLMTIMRMLGITQVFSHGADLSKVTTDAPVKLSKAVHKAVLEIETRKIDDQGGIPEMYDSLWPEVLTVVFNRSFLLVIKDETLSLPLFMGIVGYPTS